MPPTIMTVAISRNASILLPGCHSRDIGEIRLRMRAYRTTKAGRLPSMVATREIGPLSIAVSDDISPPKAKVSLTAMRPKADFLRFMLLNCLKVWGRIDMSKKTPATQKVLSQSKFQADM